jgi:hypothetical protein
MEGEQRGGGTWELNRGRMRGEGGGSIRRELQRQSLHPPGV